MTYERSEMGSEIEKLLKIPHNWLLGPGKNALKGYNTGHNTGN